ncbi:hypothetical protein ACSBR1_005459 [Camellia fascicularis]
MKHISCLFFLLLILTLWPRRTLTTDEVGDSDNIFDQSRRTLTDDVGDSDNIFDQSRRTLTDDVGDSDNIFDQSRRTLTTVGDSDHIINRACEATPYKDLCKASFKDSIEAVADLYSVANIAVKVAYLNATDTQEHVKELLSTETEAFVHQSLMDCSANYDDAIGNLEDSMAAFESKGYDHIQTLVAAAMVDPQTCEDYFNESPDHTSPLTSRNTILVKLCSNALAIVKLAAAEK